MFKRFRQLLVRGTRAVPLRRRASVEFWTGNPGNAQGRLMQPLRHMQLMTAAAALQDVERSRLLRVIETKQPSKPTDQAQVEGLEIRAAGGLGEVWIPCDPNCGLREDIDGSPIVVVGSDGTSFIAYCAGVSTDNAGVAIRFIFKPAPSETLGSLHLTLEPFSVAQARRPVTVEVALD